MKSFSHREFTDSIIIQELSLLQVIDFLYNMNIYGTNMDPIINQNHDPSRRRLMDNEIVNIWSIHFGFFHMRINLQNRFSQNQD